ncbi:MAG: hypothetical protein MZW92_23765 [Comamonadaceae bacterium]|nr:hypothetical protein [Comamonadaceae bacterium]
MGAGAGSERGSRPGELTTGASGGVCARANRRHWKEARDDGGSPVVFLEAVMKTSRTRAPAKSSARSERSGRRGRECSRVRRRAAVSTPGIAHAPARRLHLSKSGRWIARADQVLTWHRPFPSTH